MLPSSFTAVLERNSTLSGPFATEPYEAAWAHEARFFVRVLDHDRGAVLRVRTQVSPDGLHWCDLDGDEQAVDPATGSLHTWAAREFGGWLRLAGDVEAGGPADATSVTVLVYLALKA